MAKPGDTSIWKKELTFRRKPKAEKVRPEETFAPAPAEETFVPVQAAAPEELSEKWISAPAEQPAPGKTSIWKKEITFRRSSPEKKKQHAPPPADQPVKPDSVAELLRPIAAGPLDPVVMPPVSPEGSRPLAPRVPPPMPVAQVPEPPELDLEPVATEPELPAPELEATEPERTEEPERESLPVDRPLPDGSPVFGSATFEPVSERPVSEPPTFKPMSGRAFGRPASEPPVSEPPVSEPTFEPPVSEPPVSEPPVSEPPVSENPVSEPPVSEPPVSEPPVSETPVTEPMFEPPMSDPAAAAPFGPTPMPEAPVSEPSVSEPTFEPTVSEPVPYAPFVAVPVPEIPVPQPPFFEAFPVEETEVIAEESLAIPGAVVPLPQADPEPEPEPEPELELEPEQTRAPTRREGRAAKQAADRLAQEQRKRAKRLAKDAPDLHKQLVGLKIGGSQIAAAQVVNKGGPRIIRMARAPLDRGVVVGGEVRKPDELAAALKTLFRKNKLPRNCVRLGISNNRIGVRTFEISGIDDPKQLANAIRYRAQETLPIPLDEAVLDYRILEERVGADGVSTHRVLLVVAHRELVERYVAACRKAGLKLVGIDLEAFALLRALGDPVQPPAGEDAGLVCVSIGYDRSTLAVSDGRVCEFTRVLAWGGSALDEAVARVLDVEPAQIEPVKLQLSLAEDNEIPGLDPALAAEARRAMAAELQAFARELVASLRFYQEQPGSLGIGEILVTGGTTACDGLAAELERLIGVRVRVADPLARAKVPRKLQKNRDAVGSLAIAVGLGIED